jgi:hypothetical protein
MIWFYYRCAVLVFRLIFLVIYIIAGLSLLTKIPVIVLFVVRIYSLWVVNAFVSELRAEKKAAEEAAAHRQAYGDDSPSPKDGIQNPSFT